MSTPALSRRRPIVDPQGRLTREGEQFFNEVWERTGGATDSVSQTIKLAQMAPVSVIPAGLSAALTGALAPVSDVGGSAPDLDPVGAAGAAPGDISPI